MRMRRWTKVSIVLAGVVLAAGLPVRAGTGGGGAYDQLDPKDLAKALGDRGMTELLGALGDKLKDKDKGGKTDVNALAIAFQTKVNLALAPNVSEEQRNILLKEAAEILEKIADLTKDAKTAKETMDHLRFRFQLANVIGVIHAEPYALKLLYLQGGDHDRQMLRNLATKAAKLLEKLNSDIESTLQEWRLDRKKLVSVVPELEDFQKQVGYKSAWIYFYSGMSLPDTPEHRDERTVRLQDVIRGVSHWADNEPDSGVMYWSLLLRGMAFRELKDFRNALGSLQKAAAATGEGAEGVIRVRAYFEIARTRIESGDLKVAEAAIEDFGTQVRKMYAAQNTYSIDLMAALLWELLCNRRAADEQPKAGEYHVKALLKLLEIPAQYGDPAELANWAEVMQDKFGPDAPDNPVAVYAAVLDLANQWQELRRQNAKVPQELKDKTLSKLEDLLKPHGGKLAAAWKYVRPMALWRKAFLMNWERDNKEAGKLFLEIAEDKSHPLARKAAAFAANSYLGVIRDRTQTNPNEQVDPALRQGMIRALELLLAGWAKTKDGKWDPEVVTWYQDVGIQYERLAWMTTRDLAKRQDLMTKAIEAYQNFVDRAAPKMPAEMRVRHLALELRCAWFLDKDRLVSQKPDADTVSRWNNERTELVKKVVADLTAYADKAFNEASKAQDPLAGELKEWGSLAEFRAAQFQYEILKEELAAMAKMEDLPKRWPGTRITVDASEFVIRKLITQQKTPDAIARLKAFREKYKDEPQRYEQLVAAIIQQLGEKIKELRSFLQRMPGNAEAIAELARYRRDFFTFAHTLFDRDKDKNLQERYGVTKLYASALLERGAAELDLKQEADSKKSFQEALELLKQCETLDEQKRDKAAKAIDQKLADTLKAVRQIKTMQVARKGMQDYLAELKAKFGIVPSQDPDKPDVIAGPSEVAAAREYVEKAKTDEAFAQRMPAFIDKLVKAWEQLATMLKQALPMDPDVVLGLARAYGSTGQFKDALTYYDRFLLALNREKYPKLYWETMLEFCRCVVSGFRSDKEMMKALIRKIETLKKEAGYNESGLDREFSEAKARAQDAASK